MARVTRPCYISLHLVANTASCFAICSCSLSTVLNRVVRLLQRYRIKRGIAIAITVVVLLALVIGFFAVIVPRIVEQLQQLFNILPQVSTRLRAWFDWLQSVIPMLEQFRAVESPSTTSNLGSSAAEQLLSYSITRLPLSLAAVLGSDHHAPGESSQYRGLCTSISCLLSSAS